MALFRKRPFPPCAWTVSHSRAAAGAAATALLGMRSAFSRRGRLSAPLLMQMAKSGLSIPHILTG